MLPVKADGIEADVVAALQSRDLVRAEKGMLRLPQAECSVIHHFGPGLYIREVHMPAGIVAVGHYQRFAHMNIFLRGKVRMLLDDGTTRDLEAPMLFVGQPGRKAGVVLEDVVWQNIYATEETDIEKLEAMFIGKSAGFGDYQAATRDHDTDKHDSDRADYLSMLQEMGFSHETARAQSENTEDQCPFPMGSWRVKTGPSSIDGQGLFATAPINSGEIIAPARIEGKRTPAGRYTNHAINPNAAMRACNNGDIDLVALRRIEGCHGGQDGEEITIDYRQALRVALEAGTAQ